MHTMQRNSVGHFGPTLGHFDPTAAFVIVSSSIRLQSSWPLWSSCGPKWPTQWRIQDLKEGAARSIARKLLATPLINAFLKVAGCCFRPSGDEKPPFKERIVEASKFIVGSSCQLSISLTIFGIELLSLASQTFPFCVWRSGSRD
jgi:hypothetical protein